MYGHLKLKKIIFPLIIFSIIFSGCDSKLRREFKNGSTLVCIKHNSFSKDDSAIITKHDADYHNGWDTQKVQSEDGFTHNGISYDEDDCALLK